MSKPDKSHSEAIVEMLRNDPALADEYLNASLEAVAQEGGEQALLMALRHVAEAQGMSVVARRAGMPRESVYRALSARGNPTIKTLLAVLHGTGLKLSVHHAGGQALAAL